MRIHWFQKKLGTNAEVKVVKTYPEFEEYLATKPACDFTFLDHDLGFVDEHGRPGPEGDGVMAAKFLKETFGSDGHNTLIHSFNRGGAARMQALLPRSVVLPFGQFEVEVEE